MKRLQRAIRPALLAACGLVYLLVIILFAGYLLRLQFLRRMIADVQTLKVGSSTSADAAVIAERYRAYLYPSRGCTRADCDWGMAFANGLCGKTFSFIHPWKSGICDVLLGFRESLTANSLGMRSSTGGIGFKVRHGNVVNSSVWIRVDGSYDEWLRLSWEFLPDKPEPWMSTHETELYEYSGYIGKGGWVELITPSMPDAQRLKAINMTWNCLDSLSGCISLKDRLRKDTNGPAAVNGGAWRNVKGPTPSATILWLGILGSVAGALCLWASRAKALRAKHRDSVVISLGRILIALGATAVYITTVSDDVSLWVWLVAALIWTIIFRFGPPAPRVLLWRHIAYGSIALFAGSLLGGLVDLEDYFGLIIVGVILTLTALVTRELPELKIEKLVRGIVCAAAPVFGSALWLLSRLQIINLQGETVASLKIPFEQWWPLPEWFDRLELDIWLKIGLITSFLLVGLLSATFFTMRALHSRRHAQVPAS